MGVFYTRPVEGEYCGHPDYVKRIALTFLDYGNKLRSSVPEINPEFEELEPMIESLIEDITHERHLYYVNQMNNIESLVKHLKSKIPGFMGDGNQGFGKQYLREIADVMLTQFRIYADNNNLCCGSSFGCN